MSDETAIPGRAEKDGPLPQKPALGIALYSFAVLMIVVMNAFIKKATEYHTPVEAVFYRGIIAMALLLAYAAYKQQLRGIYKTSRIGSHIGRALVGNIGVVTVYWSYSLMPMADVTAMMFASPLIVTALSAVMLKETVGRYRWLAVLAGFAGILLIAQPSGEAYVSYGPYVVLLASFSTALVHIFLRTLGKTEDALTTVFYFLAFGLIVTGIYMVFAGTPPHPAAVIPLIGAGLASGVQLIAKTQAYRLAEASLLSPFSFTSIIWATLFGWMFWDDLPEAIVVCGMAVVIASNLFILWRENLKKKK